jgi:archaeosine-15-forming tRNA-guanine transglycosylase
MVWIGAATGLLALTPRAARRFVRAIPPPKQGVVVGRDAAEFASQGRSVFARHVISADPERIIIHSSMLDRLPQEKKTEERIKH